MIVARKIMENGATGGDLGNRNRITGARQLSAFIAARKYRSNRGQTPRRSLTSSPTIPSQTERADVQPDFNWGKMPVAMMGYH